MKNILLITLSFLLFSCKEKPTEIPNANAIIDASIKVSGGSHIDTSTISFDFRDMHYHAERTGGKFRFERIFKDSVNDIKDVLSNSGFERFRNDSLITIPDSMATKYTASVNSVHYFSVLPYGLNNSAVNKTYLDQVEIKGNSYYKIEVTFNKEGGGEDFEDIFIYWVNILTDKVDYLAYSYKEEDGIGFRFREAFNERYIHGVRIVDYNNYKPKDPSLALKDLDRLFLENKLELLSNIELKNVTVN